MHKLTGRLASIMVGGALIAALILAISHGAEKGGTWYLKLALIIGLVCVSIGEFLSWHNAATAWHERRAGSMALWGVLGAVLSAGTLYTNFASSASNNDTKAGIAKAAMIHQSDTDATEAELTQENNNLLQRIAMAPKRTAEAADAAIQNAKAHRLWGVTKGCTETKGKQTRQFCDEYASAVSDRAGATRLIADKEEQRVVAKKLEEVRAKRGDVQQVAMGEDQPSVMLIASKLEIDKAQARQIDSMVLPVLVQAMLLFGGILLANESFRGKPSRPWINWGAIGSLWARLYKFFTGNDLVSSAHTREIIRDDGFAARIAALRTT